MTRHLPGSWAAASTALLAAVDRRRGPDRQVVAAVVAEVVVDASGATWVVIEHGLASSAAIAPAAVLREIAVALGAAADEQEERQLQ